MNINQILSRDKRSTHRGAPMGNDFGLPDDQPAYLQRVELDSCSYARDNTYWGIGQALWCLFDAAGTYRRYVRASTRAKAFEQFDDTYAFVTLKKSV